MSSIKEELYNLFTGIEGINSAIGNLIVSAISIALWIIVGFILSFIVRKIIKRFLKLSKDNARSITIGKLLNNIFKYVIWFIIVISILSELNVEIAPIIAAAGVLGLAVGFGAQEIVKDFISGFFIIFEGSFNVGEIIEVDGFKGTVLTLGLRTTTIENWKGEVRIINNGDISSVINFSRNNSIAIVEFGVAYDTDLMKLSEIMDGYIEKAFDEYDPIVEKPKFLGVSALADSSINVLLIAKTNSMEHFQVERDMRRDIVKLCEDNNIEIPFPHVVVKNG